MIEFYRDVLSGPLYIVVALLSLIFIMAIIGFMMERKKLENEEKGRIAYVNNSIDSMPTADGVAVAQAPVATVDNNTINNEIPQKPGDDNPALLVKTPVVVFDDPDKKA